MVLFARRQSGDPSTESHCQGAGRGTQTTLNPPSPGVFPKRIWLRPASRRAPTGEISARASKEVDGFPEIGSPGGVFELRKSTQNDFKKVRRENPLSGIQDSSCSAM